MTPCLKCKRPLTDPRSVGRGYGAVCHKKAMAEAEAAQDFDALHEIEFAGYSWTKIFGNVYAVITPEHNHYRWSERGGCTCPAYQFQCPSGGCKHGRFMIHELRKAGELESQRQKRRTDAEIQQDIAIDFA